MGGVIQVCNVQCFSQLRHHCCKGLYKSARYNVQCFSHLHTTFVEKVCTRLLSRVQECNVSLSCDTIVLKVCTMCKSAMCNVSLNVAPPHLHQFATSLVSTQKTFQHFFSKETSTCDSPSTLELQGLASKHILLQQSSWSTKVSCILSR